MEENNNKLTLGNYLTVLGFPLVLIPIFLGTLLATEDGKPLRAVLVTAGVAIGLIFFLSMSIKAKKRDDNPLLWPKIKYGSLLLYIVVACLAAKPFLSFFSFFTNETEIRAIADSDIESISNCYKKYDLEAGNKLADARENIKNYHDADAHCDEIDQIVPDGNGIERWYNNRLEAVRIPQSDISYIDNYRKSVSEWNYLQLLPLANKIGQKASNLTNVLTSKITQDRIPVIAKQDGNYKVTGYVSYDDLDIGTPTAQFLFEMQNLSTKNLVLGIVFYVIFHLLVLASYYLSRGSNFEYPPNQIDMGLDI